MSDAREAAGRLLKFYDYPNNGTGVVYRDMTPSEAACALANDAIEVSRAVLAQHPADEGEALSDTWLQEQGGKWDDLMHAFGFAINTRQFLWVRTNGQHWLTCESLYGGRVCLRKRITTRGQLRDLLSALGISGK